nr:hypothetical protein GCM10020093_082540 [Planobispora longispora]
MTWDLFALLYARVEADLGKALQRGHGLGLSEYRALRQLAAAPGGELRMQELAEAVGLNQSSVTRLITRLEEAGLTRRTLCSDDRRGVYSVITAAGRTRLSEATPPTRAAWRPPWTGPAPTRSSDRWPRPCGPPGPDEPAGSRAGVRPGGPIRRAVRR